MQNVYFYFFILFLFSLFLMPVSRMLYSKCIAVWLVSDSGWSLLNDLEAISYFCWIQKNKKKKTKIAEPQSVQNTGIKRKRVNNHKKLVLVVLNFVISVMINEKKIITRPKQKNNTIYCYVFCLFVFRTGVRNYKSL